MSDKVISAQGWHQRLRQSLAWLLWLFGALLAAPPPSWSGPTSQRILLVDGTEVKSLGPKGALWRLHCAYNPACRLPGLGASDHSPSRRKPGLGSCAERRISWWATASTAARVNW